MRQLGIAALVVGLLAVAPAVANPNKTTAPATGPIAGILKDIHGTVALLNAANHDYNGHRAKAVHYLKEAAHALEQSPHHHAHHHHTTTVKAPAVHEDQKVSDAQLRAAVQQIKADMTVVAALPASSHHQKALVDLAAAIKELDVALTIK
jgi:hypothetical protein